MSLQAWLAVDNYSDVCDSCGLQLHPEYYDQDCQLQAARGHGGAVPADQVQPHQVLYCTVLYCTVLYCTVLYCTT